MKILYYTEELGVGGIEKMMLQWIKNKPNSFHIDVFACRISDDTYKIKYEELGCNVFISNTPAKNYIKKMFTLNAYLSNNKYDIIHAHISNSVDSLLLLVAKFNGIKVRLSHSHNDLPFSLNVKSIANILFRPFNRMLSTMYLGCSIPSIRYIFGDIGVKSDKKVVIKNGIDINIFKFDEEKRFEIRSRFNIEDDIILFGSVGRLDYQKDYLFLLDILASLNISTSKFKLLIVGEGEYRPELEKYAREHGLNLILPGVSFDVPSYLCAFDFFVAPSRYEGLPVVTVEAQMNGLQCYSSLAIPMEANINGLNSRLSKDDKATWIKTFEYIIISYHYNFTQRSKNSMLASETNWNITETCKDLYKLYFDIIK